jgi:hypothetical protein
MLQRNQHAQFHHFGSPFEDDCPPFPSAAGDDIGADNSQIKLRHLQNLLYIMLKTNLCSHGEGQLCNQAKETSALYTKISPRSGDSTPLRGYKSPQQQAVVLKVNRISKLLYPDMGNCNLNNKQIPLL